METGNPIGDFLRAKRELLRPEDAGLPSAGQRRAQGLRREEVASLAGLSPEEYRRLEHGDDRSPSDTVLDDLTKALQLDEESSDELRTLARSTAVRRREQGSPEQVSPRLAALISSWPNQAVFIQGRLFDVLAANPLAAALSPMLQVGANVLRAAFLDLTVRELYQDWEGLLARTVGGLRALIGPNVDDPQLAQLVGELSVRSAEFRRLWAEPEAAIDDNGSLQLRHPQVGELELHGERLSIDGADGQVLVILHAEPGTPSESAFRRLAAIAIGGVVTDAHRSPPEPVQIESKRRAQ
jgi:transcriptional regulator with XRE-family HTH domain